MPPEPERHAVGRKLELAALLAGLLIGVVGTLAIGLVSWSAAGLPEDTERYIRWRGFAGPFMMPAGLAVFLTWLVDMARAPNLRDARARYRMAGLVILPCLSSIAALTEAAIDPLLSTGKPVDGAALLAAIDAFAIWDWVARTLLLAFLFCTIAAHRAPRPLLQPEGPDGRYRSAWLPPIFGDTPALPARQWRIIGLMAAAGIFNAYDMQLFSLALKQIQAGLGIEEARLGLLGSVIRLGVIPGALLALLADSLGRRRLLLWTIAGYTLATIATALAPNEELFIVFQFLARTFGGAEAILAGVVIAEEVDANQRGWAMGVLGALSFLGIAMAWILFATVDTLPGGWRSLYLVGIGPLFFLIWLRRRLPETQRFEGQHPARSKEGSGWRGLVQPVVNLVRMYPGRMAAAAGVAFLMSLSGVPAGFFFPKFMQDVHGLAPDQLTMVAAGVALTGLIAMPVLGRLGDRRGRKPVMIAFIILNPLTVMGLYLSGGLALPLLFFLGMSLTDIGSDTNLGTAAREIFPTSYRSTAIGVLATIGTIGASASLALESVLYGVLGSHAYAIAMLAVPGLVVPFIVAFGYPESSRLELEDVSPERASQTES